MNTTIRTAVPGDIEAVMHTIDICRADMITRGINNWNEEYPFPELLLQDITEGTVFLLYQDDTLAGNVTVTPHMYERALREITWQGPDDDCLEIARLCIDPAYQGQGLGRQLFDHALRHAVRRGTRSIRLEVISSERHLIEMYARRGFTLLGSVLEGDREYVAMEYLPPKVTMTLSTPGDTRHQEVIAACQEIRRVVFIIGQDVPVEIDLDGRDEIFDHVLLSYGEEPAGCVRLNTSKSGTVKLERLAVLDRFQGYGFGKRLVEAAIEQAKERSLGSVTMHAQCYLEEFYASFGFRPTGEPFFEADIPHISMSLRL